MFLLTKISCILWTNKGLGNPFEVKFCPKKKMISYENSTTNRLSFSNVKMLQLAGKIGKAFKVRNCFCLFFPVIFSKLKLALARGRHAAKTCACLLRISRSRPLLACLCIAQFSSPFSFKQTKTHKDTSTFSIEMTRL